MFEGMDEVEDEKGPGGIRDGGGGEQQPPQLEQDMGVTVVPGVPNGFMAAQ